MDEVLFEAAQILDERGWHQGWFEGPAGEVCIAGAVKVALWGCPTHEPVFGTADWELEMDKFITLKNFLGCAASTYNDHPERTKEECVKRLMEAAEVE